MKKGKEKRGGKGRKKWEEKGREGEGKGNMIWRGKGGEKGKVKKGGGARRVESEG